jgi:hypothetical protein
MDRIIPVWDSPKDYYTGYLGAFLDGEGHICITPRRDRSKWNEYSWQIGFSQKDEEIVKKLEEALNHFNFKYATHYYDRKGFGINRIAVLGSIQEKLRFLGTVQSVKTKRVDLTKFETCELRKYQKVKIQSITPVGMQTVVGLETTSGTYIVEGFPCHNSAFDTQYLNARFIYHNLPPPAPYKIIDTLHIKKTTRFQMNNLDFLCKHLGLREKIDTGGFGLWKRCMAGDEQALKDMRIYNENDVLALEELYVRLRPWLPTHPNMALFLDQENGNRCSRCTSENIEYIGQYATSVNLYNSYRCLDCGAIFRARQSATPRAKFQNLRVNIPIQ